MNGNNALKATGPKTSAGKTKSSKNALKHGLLAATPVLPGLERIWNSVTLQTDKRL
jgi:hypothetical protein